MIPLANKEKLIARLEEGYDLKDAMMLAQIPKTSLYRLFKEQPGFKVDVENAIAKGTTKVVKEVKKMEDRNLEELRNMINRRK